MSHDVLRLTGHGFIQQFEADRAAEVVELIALHRSVDLASDLGRWFVAFRLPRRILNVTALPRTVLHYRNSNRYCMQTSGQ